MCGWDTTRSPAHTWTVELAGISYPSLNQLGGNMKNNPKYRAFRNRLAKLLKEQLNAIPRAEKFRVGIITREYGRSERGVQKRAYDEENMIGGGKGLVDTLRDYAVIVNDDPGHWKGFYRQERSPDGIDRIRIQLLEYP